MGIVKKGEYQHYKGNFYIVLGIGRNSETMEEMAIYQTQYNSKKFGRKAIWVRPKKMFLEKVKVDGKYVPRFKFLKK